MTFEVWNNYICYYCKKNYMYLKGSKRGEHGYSHVFTNVTDPKFPSISTETRVSCVPCAEKNGLIPKIKEKPLEDGISVSVEDFKLLRFARSNIFCKIIYKLFANKS